MIAQKEKDLGVGYSTHYVLDGARRSWKDRMYFYSEKTIMRRTTDPKSRSNKGSARESKRVLCSCGDFIQVRVLLVRSGLSR